MAQALLCNSTPSLSLSSRTSSKATRQGYLCSFRKPCSYSVRASLEDSEQTSVSKEQLSVQWLEHPAALASLSLVPLLIEPDVANAVDGAFGPLEGLVSAFVHPVVMGGLLLLTVLAGYQGWQWRRVRTIGDDIAALKKQLPEPVEGAPPSPLAAEIAKLTEERQQLVKGGFKDKHFVSGSILLSLGVTLSVGGALNTWIRTGKLFPGPHLWAGAGITVLWALAAALVPAMQKGNDSARSAHIALNAINLSLFLWQVPTGLEIVGKLLSFNIPLF